MEATTIKVHQGTKAALDSIRQGTQSYDETIRVLISKRKREQLETELREGYTACAEADKRLVAEWDHTAPEPE
jgi:predicted CopG family antitoxin